MTLRALRQNYLRLKKLYYANIPMPPASAIKMKFTGPENKLYLDHRTQLAVTVKLEDDPQYDYLMEFHQDLKLPYSNRLMILMLLHEMSHVARWGGECGDTEAWRQECVRLGNLGVLKEFF